MPPRLTFSSFYPTALECKDEAHLVLFAASCDVLDQDDDVDSDQLGVFVVGLCGVAVDRSVLVVVVVFYHQRVSFPFLVVDRRESLNPNLNLVAVQVEVVVFVLSTATWVEQSLHYLIDSIVQYLRFAVAVPPTSSPAARVVVAAAVVAEAAAAVVVVIADAPPEVDSLPNFAIS